MNFNVNSKQINQDKLKDLFLGCLLLFFICHAYCFLNMTFNHDSMNNIYRDHSQNMWQIQLGRIFQPINTRIEGNITPPLLLGTLSFLYSLVAMTVVGKLLRLRNNTQTLLDYARPKIENPQPL